MIGFGLTEEQKAIQEMAKEFAEKELKPNAAKYDKGDEFPEDVMTKAFEAGFLTCTIPTEYGGGGLNDLDTVIMSEELATGCAGMYTTMMVKTHLSLSHDPTLKGVPKGWMLPIRDVLIYSGAKFLCPCAGDITLMPGTSSNPAFRRVDVDVKTGKVQGLF